MEGLATLHTFQKNVAHVVHFPMKLLPAQKSTPSKLECLIIQHWIHCQSIIESILLTDCLLFIDIAKFYMAYL